MTLLSKEPKSIEYLLSCPYDEICFAPEGGFDHLSDAELSMLEERFAREDPEGEAAFNYGFNVLYAQERDNQGW